MGNNHQLFNMASQNKFKVLGFHVGILKFVSPCGIECSVQWMRGKKIVWKYKFD